MRVLLFGATGMIGRGVLDACVRAPDVDEVVTVGRRATGVAHARLRELVVADVGDLAPVADQLGGFDACFFCLGVSSAGMAEARYTALTHDLTLSVARTLLPRNPALTFVFVSGLHTDANGRAMWQRVKGRTENALLAFGFRAAYMFRPGVVEPLPGGVSRTGWYRALYAVLTPLFPLLRRLFPDQVTTAAGIGAAMLAVVRRGYERPVLEPPDIVRAAAAPTA